MENNRMEQLEALGTLVEFNDRLLRNLPTIIGELSGERKADTDDFLKTIINVVNWEINVTNATLDVLNEDHIRIDKEAFNKKISSLGSSLSLNDDAAIASALEELIPFFEQLGKAAREVTQ